MGVRAGAGIHGAQLCSAASGRRYAAIRQFAPRYRWAGGGVEERWALISARLRSRSLHTKSARRRRAKASVASAAPKFSVVISSSAFGTSILHLGVKDLFRMRVYV